MTSRSPSNRVQIAFPRLFPARVITVGALPITESQPRHPRPRRDPAGAAQPDWTRTTLGLSIRARRKIFSRAVDGIDTNRVNLTRPSPSARSRRASPSALRVQTGRSTLTWLFARSESLHRCRIGGFGSITGAVVGGLRLGCSKSCDQRCRAGRYSARIGTAPGVIQFFRPNSPASLTSSRCLVFTPDFCAGAPGGILAIGQRRTLRFIMIARRRERDPDRAGSADRAAAALCHREEISRSASPSAWDFTSSSRSAEPLERLHACSLDTSALWR